MGELVVGILSMASFVFIASAGSKLRGRPAFQSFRAGLREAAVVPEHLLPATAAVLAGSEAAIAIALAAAAVLVGTGTPGAATAAVLAFIAAALLTAALAAGVAGVMRRGISARCACFGAASDLPLGRVQLARNLSLLAAEGAGLALSLQTHRPALAGVAVAILAGLVVALLVVRWEDLAALITPLPPMPGTASTAPQPEARRRG
jgi:hypothetical protein